MVVSWQRMWPADDGVPAVIARVPLMPFVQHLRATNGHLPNLALVPDTIATDGREVGLILIDVANMSDDDELTAACMTPIVSKPGQLDRAVLHARRMAAAPFC